MLIPRGNGSVWYRKEVYLCPQFVAIGVFHVYTQRNNLQTITMLEDQ